MGCQEFMYSFFKYQTPKIVSIHSTAVGVLSRIVQLTIVAYIIGYVIVFKKGYQEFSDVQSSVTTKFKGVAFTNFSDDEFKRSIQNKDSYRRVWDVADYVVPPSENGATFVTTNVIITANQKQSTCAEDPTIPGAQCDPSNYTDTCIPGKSLIVGNGVMTGNCVQANTSREPEFFSCEIHAWCPVEKDVLPLKNNTALLSASENFTILIKNFVDFPKFKNSNRRNIKDTTNKTYLQNCLYDVNDNKECPVFRLREIIGYTGEKFKDVASKGAVIAIIITWDCNFDWNKKYCFPTYSFRRLDDPTAKLAPGWNFRYANFYGDGRRTLYKLYGIKFSIIVQGQAGRFNIIPLFLNVGAGLGLLALEVVVCDIVVLYMTKQRGMYRSKKYEEVDSNSDNDEFTVVVPTHKVEQSSPKPPSGHYEQLID